MKLGIYQHYKGKFYKVIGVATHSENFGKASNLSSDVWKEKTMGKTARYVYGKNKNKRKIRKKI